MPSYDGRWRDGDGDENKSGSRETETKGAGLQAQEPLSGERREKKSEEKDQDYENMISSSDSLFLSSVSHAVCCVGVSVTFPSFAGLLRPSAFHFSDPLPQTLFVSQSIPRLA